ncbi:DUF5693 family protein [Paenibacillus melissococcoides]|uniref:DUF5693 family protein n=1 Tax=Paenibacillus melissococcoides TaxID=2912268 RepID=A0ABM9G9P5_9BACL|nr:MULTISPECIES: DUF5693 family protein [Paenibacillus]MEB9897200.1 DUF5693 family protein [Bacillus cereus]CAH8248741.1 DUF5693 family protein [Paenibacillus melissococcoides]CAH8713869.1 DUF5693 family protein [Paenibacillus melissococcoides]CAH8720363.1 DUF5693 family protein [Paenibacillus melissococcoides]GIO78421.1 hypothetical protein J6TS7_20310 [Paenibacillus dendritiformis]
MLQQLERWNRRMKKWLWLLVIVGLVAAIPVAVQRVQTEQSSNQVELVVNYRNLVEAAAYAPQPTNYMNEQLERLKQAGIGSMAMFESSLAELRNANRVVLYNSQDAALLDQKTPPLNENYTYVLFTSPEYAERLSPMIEKTFLGLDINVRLWSGRDGLIIEAPVESTSMKPLPQDPIAIEQLLAKGFHIVPRLSDALPYNQEQVEALLKSFHDIGVKTIIFDGESVKGFNDDLEMNSLTAFADLLKKYDIAIAAIEGLKVEQKGMKRLAYLTDYNVIRLHSITDQEAFNEPDVLGDRLSLATKDRNIRMIYFNIGVKKDFTKAEIVNSIDNMLHSLKEPGQAIASIEANGYTLGQAEAFHVVDAPWQRYAKLLVVIGGVAMIALMISFFVPYVMLPAFLIGLIGSAGLFVLKPNLLEQALALGVAISAPTIAMVLAVRRVDMSPTVTAGGTRLAKALGLFLRTTVLSLMAVPFVIALLNNITYSLVLEQFRGVSLLHFVPIVLTALYVFLYRGESVFKEGKRWLFTPITVLWVIALGIVGAVGLFYLSRTGNAGTLLPGEATFRALLENTIGVRPRNKEFLMAHPLLIAGAFIAYRYRFGIYLFIIGSIGQLSMVDTFAHIHTPVIISLIRTVLGIGLGIVVALIFVLIWTIIERCWEAWRPKFEA